MQDKFEEFLDWAAFYFAEKNYCAKEDVRITYLDFNGASGNVTVSCILNDFKIDTERFKV